MFITRFRSPPRGSHLCNLNATGQVDTLKRYMVQISAGVPTIFTKIFVRREGGRIPWNRPRLPLSKPYSSFITNFPPAITSMEQRGLLAKLTVSQRVKAFITFKKPENSSPCSQKPKNGSMRIKLNLVHTLISYFNNRFNIILPSVLWSPKWSLPLRFSE